MPTEPKPARKRERKSRPHLYEIAVYPSGDCAIFDAYFMATDDHAIMKELVPVLKALLADVTDAYGNELHETMSERYRRAWERRHPEVVAAEEVERLERRNRKAALEAHPPALTSAPAAQPHAVLAPPAKRGRASGPGARRKTA